MKNTKLMTVGTLVLFCAGIAAAQSLGDYARAVRKNKPDTTSESATSTTTIFLPVTASASSDLPPRVMRSRLPPLRPTLHPLPPIGRKRPMT